MKINDCKVGMMVRGVDDGSKWYYATDKYSKCKIVKVYKDTVKVETLGHEKSGFWESRVGRCYYVRAEEIEALGCPKLKVRRRNVKS